MNASNCSWVCSPRASASSMSLSAATISRTRAMSCGGGTAQRVPHPAELAVEHLAAQQVLDLGVRLARLVAAPPVVRQLPDRPGGVVRQRVQLGLGKSRGVVRVGEQRPPLGRQRPVEQLPDLLQGAVQPAAPARGPGLLADPAAQLVQAAQAVGALLQQPAQRLGRAGAGQDLVADLVQCAPDVERRLQRVRPAVPRAVPVPARPAHPTALPAAIRAFRVSSSVPE